MRREILLLHLPEALKKVGALPREKRIELSREPGPGFVVGVAHRLKDACRLQDTKSVFCLGELTIRVVGEDENEVWLEHARYWHARAYDTPPYNFEGIIDLWIPLSYISTGDS